MPVTPKIIIPFKLSEYTRLQEGKRNPRILSGESEITLIETNRESGNYPIKGSDGVLYSVNGKPELRDLPVLKIEADMKNPIENGRLACGMTFALRLLNFVKGTQVCDAASEDEQESLINMASELLRWQVATAEDPREIEYLKMNGVWERN